MEPGERRGGRRAWLQACSDSHTCTHAVSPVAATHRPCLPPLLLQTGLTIQLLLFPDSLREEGGARKPRAPALPKVRARRGPRVQGPAPSWQRPRSQRQRTRQRPLPLPNLYAPWDCSFSLPPQVSVTDSVFELRRAFQEAERLGEAQARKEIQRSMASRDEDGGEQAGKK